MEELTRERALAQTRNLVLEADVVALTKKVEDCAGALEDDVKA